MADIELVIKVDEKIIQQAKHYHDLPYDDYVIHVAEAIANGTLLPKGHGKLIDADEIQFENAEFDTYGDYCIAFDAIDQADPIIEADKGE